MTSRGANEVTSLQSSKRLSASLRLIISLTIEELTMAALCSLLIFAVGMMVALCQTVSGLLSS